jgi:stress-induced morphogen
MAVRSAIISKLTSKLKPFTLDVLDESATHAGHAAMKGIKPVESHFSIEIVSNEFHGLSKLQRQRLVYATLSEEMESSIHALRMICRTPEEVQSIN